MRATPMILAALGLPVAVLAVSNTSWPWQSFRSAATLDPPDLKVTKHGDTAPGYLFFDQNGPEAHNYSLFIMTEDNELVWQSAMSGYSAYKPQFFRGEPVLTFFNGISFGEPYGFGYGIIQILNNAYESIYNVSLTVNDGNYESYEGFDDSILYSWIDMHEAKITPQDTMLVTLYNVTQHDLRHVGGPRNGWVTDSLFYEIDIATNEILFTWSALDHLDEIPIKDVLEFYPLEDYGQNKTLPYGYFHINSVEKTEDGSYLISSRFFSSIFKIARDGTVDWTLEGNSGGDFDLGPGISFRYQHDARIHRETDTGLVISLFNNFNSDVTYGVNETNGLILYLDTQKWKATLIKELVDPNDTIYAASQGNLEMLPGGNGLMSYGSTPKMKEFGPDGTLLMTMQFGPGDGYVFSYRGYKAPWVGVPNDPPSLYACLGPGNSTQVYMSWNGATEHTHWNVFGGRSEDQLQLAKTVVKQGYETVTDLPSPIAFVQVEASMGGSTSKRSIVTSPSETC